MGLVVTMQASSSLLKQLLFLQVHYYEDGNVMLVSSKEVSEKLNITVSLIVYN